MPVTLAGTAAVPIPVEAPRASRGTPVLMIAARGVHDPRASRAAVRVELARTGGRAEEIGNFAFFGAPPGGDEQVFAFPLAPAHAEALARGEARIQATLHAADERADLAGLRFEVRAWIETR